VQEELALRMLGHWNSKSNNWSITDLPFFHTSPASGDGASSLHRYLPSYPVVDTSDSSVSVLFA
jgi:hypothetical protein